MPKLGGSTLHVILPYICESSTLGFADWELVDEDKDLQLLREEPEFFVIG